MEKFKTGFKHFKQDLQEQSMTTIWFKYRNWLLGVLVIFLISIGLGIFTVTQFFAVPTDSQPVDDQILLATSEESISAEMIESESGEIESTSESVEEENAVAETWYVDLKGAVVTPQVVPISPGMRVHDVIDIAGGLLPDADESKINLAQLATDQMVVYVPIKGEQVEASVTSLVEETATMAEEDSSKTGDSELVNINTADATQLQTLSGIGEKKAADIIQYRETEGAFESVDDLTEVSGIGDKTLENLRDFVTVD